MTRFIGKNAVEFELQDHIKIHKVVNVSHTVPYHEQPKDIEQHVQPRPDPVGQYYDGKMDQMDPVFSKMQTGGGRQYFKSEDSLAEKILE